MTKTTTSKPEKALKSSKSAFQGRIAELEQELANTVRSLDAARQECAAVHREIDRVHMSYRRSTSWRVTAPLRAAVRIGRRLTGLRVDLLKQQNRAVINGNFQDGHFIANDDDPQILIRLDREMPAGWYRVQTISETENTAYPRIYIGINCEFSEKKSALFSPGRTADSYEAHFFSAAPFNSVRFDPIDYKGDVSLRALSIQSYQPFSRYLSLGLSAFKALRHRPTAFWQLWRKYRGRTQGVDFLDLASLKNPALGDAQYAEWIKKHDYDPDTDREELKKKAASLPCQPLISVVMPVYNTDIALLDACIQSVINQVYENWELCIADDASPNGKVVECLKSWEAKDKRIKVVYRQKNGHICRATNSALELAEGEWIALLDHDDLLPSNALYWIAKTVVDNPDATLIYSDEDKLDHEGRRCGHHFKPDWNEELFLTQNYINHLGVYRADLVRQIGGFRPGFEGSQDHDFALRFIHASHGDGIIHIPRILYHWRAFGGSGSYSDRAMSKAISARRRAVADYLELTGQKARVVDGPYGTNRVVRSLPSTEPLVSVIIPTRNRSDLLKACIESILKNTSYRNYEIIVVDNGSDEQEALDYFEDISKLKDISVLSMPGEFNFSALNNYGARHARGDYLVLLNNDTETINGDWLGELVTYASLPVAGAVGAKLLYPDGRIQHAGVVLGVGGIANHGHQFISNGHPGYHSRPHLPQYVTAVTGACLAVSREKYFEVGGLDEEKFKVAFNDIDFCLKLRARGYQNVYTPFATLTHYESVSRGQDIASDKLKRLENESRNMYEKWGDTLDMDPFYNPNLNRDSAAGEFSVGL